MTRLKDEVTWQDVVIYTEGRDELLIWQQLLGVLKWHSIRSINLVDDLHLILMIRERGDYKFFYRIYSTGVVSLMWERNKSEDLGEW